MNAQQVPQCKQRRVTYLLTYIFYKKKKKKKKGSNIGSCPQVPVPRYSWSIVESGIKHHSSNPIR